MSIYQRWLNIKSIHPGELFPDPAMLSRQGEVFLHTEMEGAESHFWVVKQSTGLEELGVTETPPGGFSRVCLPACLLRATFPEEISLPCRAHTYPRPLHALQQAEGGHLFGMEKTRPEEGALPVCNNAAR